MTAFLYVVAAVVFVMVCGRIHSLYLDHLERKAERDYGIVPSWKRGER